MKHRRAGFIAMAALATASQAQSGRPAPSRIDDFIERVSRLRGQVEELAFQPGKLFEFQRGREDIITVAYTGDDMGWPIYSIAIREVCRPRPGGRGCVPGRAARMVRAPAPPELTRPRQRGFSLMQQMLRSGAETPEQVAAAVDKAGLEWLEGDLDACEAAAEVIRQADRIEWVVPEIHSPDPSKLQAPVLHSDMVEVTFVTFARKSSYHGYVAERSPGEWAGRLAAALEPCWRPAAAPPPWRR
ncbi:MAG TPA: hypothetical protein VF662_07310 [Allosphingosinicella sp.]|jgi:hypothetical protein